jgi:hypothetical protein
MAEVQIQDFLSALTDALRDERTNVDAVITQYDVPRQEVEPLVTLIRRLRMSLTPVKPSRRFANRLRDDLQGAPQYNVINRIRYLPAHVHIAAGVALLAGFFMLITRRRVTLGTQRKPQEAPVT